MSQGASDGPEPPARRGRVGGRMRARDAERQGGRIGDHGVSYAWLIIALKQRVGDGDHRGAVTTAEGANVHGEWIEATPRFSGAAEAARSVRTRWSGCLRVRWLGQDATPMEWLARRGAARTATCGCRAALPGGLSERWPSAML